MKNLEKRLYILPEIKKELDFELILDKRCKTNALNTLEINF